VLRFGTELGEDFWEGLAAGSNYAASWEEPEKKLNLAGLTMDVTGIRALAGLLSSCYPNLTALNLKSCGIGSSELHIMGKALQACPQAQHINLLGNQFKAHDVTAFVSHLGTRRSLDLVNGEFAGFSPEQDALADYMEYAIGSVDSMLIYVSGESAIARFGCKKLGRLQVQKDESSVSNDAAKEEMRARLEGIFREIIYWEPDYSGYDHGCISGDSLVYVSCGASVVATRMCDVCVGDVLLTGTVPSEKSCVTRIWRMTPSRSCETVQLSSGCRVTKGHPVLKQGRWCKPRHLMMPLWTNEGVLYNLELEGHVDTVLVGDTVCACIGKDCGELFNPIFHSKTVRCRIPHCKICDRVVNSQLDFSDPAVKHAQDDVLSFVESPFTSKVEWEAYLSLPSRQQRATALDNARQLINAAYCSTATTTDPATAVTANATVVSTNVPGLAADPFEERAFRWRVPLVSEGPLRCRIPSARDLMQKVRDVHGWTPGQNSIRCNPELQAQKEVMLAHINSQWHSPVDWIYHHVFNSEVSWAANGRKATIRPTHTEAVLVPQIFPYDDIPDGTVQLCLWYTCPHREWENDEFVTDAIAAYVDAWGGGDFVWLCNPKMNNRICDTCETHRGILHHVHVWWRPPPGLHWPEDA